jgi:hypothetical protein
MGVDMEHKDWFAEWLQELPYSSPEQARFEYICQREIYGDDDGLE